VGGAARKDGFARHIFLNRKTVLFGIANRVRFSAGYFNVLNLRKASSPDIEAAAGCRAPGGIADATGKVQAGQFRTEPANFLGNLYLGH
jgi:hypothetical protein